MKKISAPAPPESSNFYASSEPRPFGMGQKGGASREISQNLASRRARRLNFGRFLFARFPSARNLLTGAILVTLFVYASSAQAAIVPDECRLANPEGCTICHLGVLVMNLTEFLMYTIAFPSAVLLFAVGGILLLVFGGSDEKRVLGKKVLTNTLIGLVIVMLAWLGVDTIIKVLTGGSRAFISGLGIGPWNRLDPSDCALNRAVTAPPSAGISAPVTTPAPGTCSGCVVLSAESMPVKSGACLGEVCQVNSVLNQRLVELNRRLTTGGLPNSLRITEAWPPTRTHQNNCHQAATCVDAGFTSIANATPRNINYVAQEAQSAGLRPVWEVAIPARREALIQSGVPAANIQVVAGISGEHFSIYMQ